MNEAQQAALSLAANADAQRWLTLLSMLCLVVGTFIAFASLIGIKRRTGAETAGRIAAGLAVVAMGLVGPRLASVGMDDRPCATAASDPQVLDRLDGNQIERIRAGCAAVGHVIGEVRR